MSELFFALGPERVLDAVEEAGFRPTGHCMPLTCLENRVYDVRLEDESHVVVKFYRPGRWGRPAIHDEHRYLHELAAHEIPVCVPCTLADGDTVARIEGIEYAVWPRTGGRSPDELGDTELEILGRLLARIHNVGAAGQASHRPVLSGASYALEPLALLEEGGFLPPEVSRRYCRAAERLAALYDERSAGVPLHRIHGDCHYGNLLDGREGWFFLDFDDFLVGPAVHDVWMLVPGRDAEGVRQRALLLSAYRQFRPFDDAWLALVEPLRALRFVRYAGWIARRWDDPAFPPAFPHFGSAQYWETETRDLEQQLEAIEGGAGVAGSDPGGETGGRRAAEEPAELSNEDFFWDL